MNLIIKNGWVIEPKTNLSKKADVAIIEGRVAEIAENITVSPDDPFIDAQGLIVAPGFIDIHVHFREPGDESKETIETGAKAAAHGGVTSVVTMPNTQPPIDNEGMVELITKRGKDLEGIHIYPAGCATKERAGKELTEMAYLKKAGAIAVTDDGNDIESSAILRHVLKYSAMIDLIYLAHCEDTSLSEGGVMNEGFYSTILGLPGIPKEAEETRIERNIQLAKLANAPIHIQHVSTARGVEIIRNAKKQGIRVSAETCPHYWMLHDGLLESFDTNLKVNPPLRTKEDNLAIIEGIKDGTIDCIATDHAPHTVTEKDAPFQEAPFGMIGLETLLSCIITGLVKPGHISIEKAVKLITLSPASILKIEGGTISKGARADITIFSPDEEWTVTENSFKSQSRNSPFIGKSLYGKVKCTLCCGKVIYCDEGFPLPKNIPILPSFLS
ncbi:MAG: dihydroorotase [Candidatus Hydrogenedentes bacterium]|nr:dihydroorotase [Candidatus Hydrogenedentota bacterium]